MAVLLERNNKDWVDLGDLSVACITRPETCGPEALQSVFGLIFRGVQETVVSFPPLDITLRDSWWFATLMTFGKC